MTDLSWTWLLTGGALAVVLISLLIKAILLRAEINASKSLELVPASLPEGTRLIPRDGSELFFPEPPREENPAPVYLVTITGVLRSQYGKKRRPVGECVDAFSKTNEDGRFALGNYRFLVNNRPLYQWDVEWIEQDRCLHRYTFTVGGLRGRIGIAFDSCKRRAPIRTEGALYAAVTPLPPGTLTRKQRHEMERRERRAAQEAITREREQARCTAVARLEAEQQNRRFWAQVNALRIEAQLLANWGDPKFQKEWAKVHTDELLAQASEIRASARAILSQTAVVQQLEKTDPGALAVNLGKLGALTAAEQHSVRRRLPSPPSPKPKLTSEQVKQLKVRRQQIALGDKLALAKDRIATIQDVKAYVKAQYPDLQEDEQQAIIHQILEQVTEEDHDGDIL